MGVVNDAGLVHLLVGFGKGYLGDVELLPRIEAQLAGVFLSGPWSYPRQPQMAQKDRRCRFASLDVVKSASMFSNAYAVCRQGSW